MKKTISLILALLMCLSMCACTATGYTGNTDNATNANNKFVGTYTSDGSLNVGSSFASIERTMRLSEDGTGVIEEILKNDFKYNDAGTIARSFDVTWQCDDTYITITQTTTRDILFLTAVGDTSTSTYELKGAELFRPGESFSRWTKTS